MVSSVELAEEAGVNAATLRRDLSHLGTYGTPGTGYEVEHLLDVVDRALTLSREWPIVIAGAGDLGRALSRSRGFTTGGFRVAALVDVDPARVGTVVNGVLVRHLEELDDVVRLEAIRLGIVATPAASAADTVTRLARAGVRSILNFAPAIVTPPEAVVVRNVDLAAELQMLAFYAARADLDDASAADVARPKRRPAGG